MAKTATKSRTKSKKIKSQPASTVKKSNQPQPRLKPDKPAKLTGSFRLLARSLRLLGEHWRLFLTIILIYGFLSIILVRGIGGGLDLTNVKASLKGGFSGSFSQLATGAVLFSYLLGSSGSSANPAAGVYQTLLVIIMSLVVIWTLRQVLAGHAVRARDAFYKGTYPLVQFTLVLLVVSSQLLPLLIGSWIYTTVVNNGIAGAGFQKIIWLGLFIGLAWASLYMITSSIFALYVVTLPDMTPMKALRSARALVKFRRWTVVRKVLFLPLAVLILGALIMIPLILLLTAAAEWIFFLLSMAVLVVVHSYMYNLYRELL
ncbi:MAG: hypothetical protein ACXWLH_05090 [Candidatus Saccharimonadales bacterium]